MCGPPRTPSLLLKARCPPRHPSATHPLEDKHSGPGRAVGPPASLVLPVRRPEARGGWPWCRGSNPGQAALLTDPSNVFWACLQPSFPSTYSGLFTALSLSTPCFQCPPEGPRGPVAKDEGQVVAVGQDQDLGTPPSGCGPATGTQVTGTYRAQTLRTQPCPSRTPARGMWGH